MQCYRVQIIGSNGELADEREVLGPSPDQAAEMAVGEPLVRGARRSRKILRAKVYWDNAGTVTMVRFYQEEGVVVRF
jgi:hypothetical protein